MSIRRAQDERLEGTPDGLNAITEIMDVPDAPTIGTATAVTYSSATVAFTAAATGGTVTTFTATSTPGSITGTSATSPITVSGLSGSTSYTFKVKGTNVNGVVGPESSASNSITTPDAASYESIATFNPDSVGSVTFSSIPQTYKHLQIRTLYRSTGANGGLAENLQIQFNGVTSGYADHRLTGNGTAAAAAGSSGNSQITIYRAGLDNDTTSGMYGSSIIDIIDYTSTAKNKVLRYFAGTNNNTTSTNFSVTAGSGLWVNTAAITSITVTGTGNFANSRVALYGIKG